MSARSGVDKPMLRCDYNGAASVTLDASASGYAVIVVQCHTWRNNNPSIIWHAKVGSGSELQMTPSGNSYVACATAGGTAITFGAGIADPSAGVVESATRQTQVSFAQSAISGETARWYNGIQAPAGTTAFDAYQTQQPCLGAAGDVMMQDFITIHQFNALTVARLGIINNNTYSTLGSGTGTTTPYFCTTATNKCGGARFAEFTVLPAPMSAEELQSYGADIANKWCVPYAGPTIKKFRIVNAMLPRKYKPVLQNNVYERVSASIVAQLFAGTPMTLDYDQLLDKRPREPEARFAMHQDLAYWPPASFYGDTRTATFSLALDSTTKENGAIQFVVGSHKAQKVRPHKAAT
jgi:hypothetical protein